MPSTPLYTVIVCSDNYIFHSDNITNITFKLSEELFQQALKEIEAQQKEKDAELESLRTARNNQYQIFLMDDLPKEGQPVPEHAIYLGKSDYIVYGAVGIKRQLLQYPDGWVGIPSKNDLRKTEIKSAVLDVTLGKLKAEAPQSVTLKKYVDSYMKAYPKTDVKPHAFTGGYVPPRHTWTYPIYSAYTNSLIIKGPDNQPRDITLRVLEQDALNKPSSVEVHRFTAYKDNDQMILKTDGSDLHTLQLYAANLLSALAIKVEDEQHYPKIEITTGKNVEVLEGTKAFYAKTLREKAKESAFSRNLIFSLLVLGIAVVCLAVTLIPMSPLLLVGLASSLGGILLMFGIVAGIRGVEHFFEAKAYLSEADRVEKLTVSEPLAIHSKVTKTIFPYIRVTTESQPGDDLAILYRDVFLSRGTPTKDVNKPAATMNAEISFTSQPVAPAPSVSMPLPKPSSQKPRASK